MEELRIENYVVVFFKQLIGLEQSSEAITFQLKHVQEERDNLWNTLNEKEGELLECNALHLHCESNFDSLKKQVQNFYRYFSFIFFLLL